MTGFDIIGDVHGQAEKLKALLKQLDYRESGGAWRHPSRQAIFVGDLVDRGPRQVETIDIVRRMVDAASARCILGNHEFNAIAWATPDPERPGQYLRPHDRPGNRRQHQAFLTEVEGQAIHDELIAWFKTLPLWLDLGAFRVVHACWSAEHMAQIAPHLGPGTNLTDELVVTASRDDHWSFRAVEMICKGPEVAFPSLISVHDKEGLERRSARVKWWDCDGASLRHAILAPQHVLDALPDVLLPPGSAPMPDAGSPIFFGHYSLKTRPSRLTPSLACVDFGGASGAPLVAYRWHGGDELRDEQFVSV